MSEGLDEFMEIIKVQFDQSKDKLSPDTPFRELEEWSSLQSLILVAAIDEAYGIALRETELNQAQNLGELYQLTLQKVQ